MGRSDAFNSAGNLGLIVTGCSLYKTLKLLVLARTRNVDR